MATSDGKTPKRPRAPDLWLSEQLESVAIAIAMALVLKFFVIEAYQIPSGSMQPTILGDSATGIKDRVLADKLITMIRDPQRWEVMIFRFPNDERRLYVKRIVGLPGETLQIRGGDVWIDDAIAAKPDHVNDSVLKNVYPDYADGIELGRAFSTHGEGVTVSGPRADFAAGTIGELRLRSSVRSLWEDGYDPAWRIRPPPAADESDAVADLDVALTVELEPGANSLEVGILADEGELLFRIPREGSGVPAQVSFVGRGPYPDEVYLDDAARSIPAGERIAIAARWVDRRVVLTVDGDEWLRHDQVDLGPRPESPERALVHLIVDGGGRLDDVEIRRDIFYLPRRVNPTATWEIPADSYFGLGDNTQSSLDGRNWERRTYTTPDGPLTGFSFEHPGPNPPPDQNPAHLRDGTLAFADVHGDTTIIPAATPYSEAPAPFIHRRYLLGKVLAVFWPVYDPFRWKLVR